MDKEGDMVMKGVGWGVMKLVAFFFYPKIGPHHNFSIRLPFLQIFGTSYSTTRNSCSNDRKSYKKHRIAWTLNFFVVEDEYG